jgi:CBS domain containing-hemolysin-like protein
MNGFLLEEMGEVPAVGERMEWEGAELEIMEASETQVLKVRVRRMVTSGDEVED